MVEGSILAISEAERSVLEAEVEALLIILPESQRGPYLDLLGAVRRGEVSASCIDSLERTLEWSLRTGRARREHLAEGEALLESIYWRTPAGRAYRARSEEVCRALRSLQGRRLTAIALQPRGLNAVTIALETEGLTVTLVARPPEVILESLSTG